LQLTGKITVEFDFGETFNFHITLQKGWSNRQSAVIWGRGYLAKSTYLFYRGWKNLIHTVPLALHSVFWEEKVVENVIWGRGLAENVRIPSYGGRGLKLLKKTLYDNCTFPNFAFFSYLYVIHDKLALIFA